MAALTRNRPFITRQTVVADLDWYQLGLNKLNRVSTLFSRLPNFRMAVIFGGHPSSYCTKKGDT